MEMAPHWRQHSDEDKDAYWKEHEFLTSMTEPRVSNPIGHWESRLDLIERYLRLLKWDCVTRMRKMTAEERSAFRSRWDQVRKRWTHLDAAIEAGLLFREEGEG
jgi:hypothetical protein